MFIKIINLIYYAHNGNLVPDISHSEFGNSHVLCALFEPIKIYNDKLNYLWQIIHIQVVTQANARSILQQAAAHKIKVGGLTN